MFLLCWLCYALAIFVVTAGRFNEFLTNIAQKLVAKLNFRKFDSSKLFSFYQSKGVMQNKFKFSVVTEQETLKLLNSLNVAKATGCDNISARFLKDAASEIVCPLTHIMNLSLRMESVPSDFKQARVVPLFKKGNRNFEGNYRTVSIHPVISKILERIVHNQLSTYLQENKVIYQHQSGFRQGFSTESVLTYLTDTINLCTDKGLYTGLVLIDLQKAFDTVDHNILLVKLKAIGLTNGAISWFMSYLSDRSQFVNVNGCNSSARNVICGVPQGSILGPLLFLIYVNDMVNEVTCDLFLYADDSALMVSGRNIHDIELALETSLKNLSSWLEENKLSLHLGKTESIIFGSNRKLKRTTKLNITCNGVAIECKKQIKYLGCILDRFLSGEATVSNVAKRINGGLKFLYRKRCYFGFKERKMLCNAMFQPLFDYSAIAWFYGLSIGSRKQLQVCQNKIIRFVFEFNARKRINCDAFLKVNWLDVHGRVDMLTLNMMFRILNSTAPEYLNRFQLARDVNPYSTRGNYKSVVVPCVKSFGSRTFMYNAIKLWNSLPGAIKSCSSIGSFKARTKRYLFSKLRIRENSDFVFY